MPNPAGIAYKSFSGVKPAPGWLFIAGRDTTHWTKPQWKDARAAGAEVLAYSNFIERPDAPLSPLDEQAYGGDSSKVALWPYPNPGQRVNYPKNHLTDITYSPMVKNPWIESYLDYMGRMMSSGQVNGACLDCATARLWSALANWDSWPEIEQVKFTDGMHYILMRLDDLRRRLNPSFLLIANGDLTGSGAEEYVDGIIIEHPTLSVYKSNLAARAYNDMGNRRLIVIAQNMAEAQIVAKWPGVTHVSPQSSADYATPVLNNIQTAPGELIVALAASRTWAQNQLLAAQVANTKLAQQISAAKAALLT